MARDYAKTRNGNNKRRRSAPAAKKRKKNSKARGTPGWVWLFCGLCLGLVIAAGIYVFGRPAGGSGDISVSGVPDAAEPATTDKQSGKSDKPEKKVEKARFDFYKMLPNYEVVVPEEEYTEEDGGGDEPETTAKVEAPGRYVIQTGSFGDYGDADRRKAKLALLGIESEIKEVQLDDGRTVYRVHTQPVSDVDTLNKTLDKLRDNDIDTLVMRDSG